MLQLSQRLPWFSCTGHHGVTAWTAILGGGHCMPAACLGRDGHGGSGAIAAGRVLLRPTSYSPPKYSPAAVKTHFAQLKIRVLNEWTTVVSTVSAL